MTLPPMKRISEVVWEIPTTFKEGMRVPARIYATEKLLNQMDYEVFNQITNVACLPGIQGYAMAMPDAHWGYGFPIGGVAAMDAEGVISPGGLGYDLNCGVRLVRTNLTEAEVKPRVRELLDEFFRIIPTGVGCKGTVHLSVPKFKDVMVAGAKWCEENGFGWSKDSDKIEDYGQIKGADPVRVTDHAISRGIDQLGTLGSGNHYCEIQTVSKIFDSELAKAFGIDQVGQVCVMVHCGSRGFGHQVATDYLRIFENAMPRYGIKVRDPQLACAPFKSKEGENYFAGMACAANNAFANRQLITHRVREAFSRVFKRPAEEMGIEIVYDVAHNIGKIEHHEFDGFKGDFLVHRKGSTRCFPPGRSELPHLFQKTGQPVNVGGSMETGSYLCVGLEGAMKQTFGSTMHGSGRTMSRTAAKRQVYGEELQKRMAERGILVKSASMSGLAEEAGFAYKDLGEVVDTMEIAGVSKKLVELHPIGNIKG